MLMNTFFVFLLIIVGVANAKNLPSFLELCPKSVKEAGPCIMKNVDILKPMLAKGIPELLIPSLDPLELQKADLNTPGFAAAFKNCKLYNLNNFELNDLKLNLDTLDLEIALNFPHMYCDAEYQFKGKILILEVDSHGPCKGNFTGLSANVKGRLNKFDKNGKQYLKLDKTNIDLDIKGAWMQFDKIFGDNKELTDNANKVINENSADVLKEFLPVIKEVILGVVTGITNRIFAKFPFDDLFP